MDGEELDLLPGLHCWEGATPSSPPRGEDQPILLKCPSASNCHTYKLPLTFSHPCIFNRQALQELDLLPGLYCWEGATLPGTVVVYACGPGSERVDITRGSRLATSLFARTLLKVRMCVGGKGEGGLWRVLVSGAAGWPPVYSVC